MSQNPEQPQQNNYSQYPPYEPTQAASPYDPNQAGYPGQGYPQPGTTDSGAGQYAPQSPYGAQSPYPAPNAYPAPGSYPPANGQPNPSGMYPPNNPYTPGAPPPFQGYPPAAPKKKKTWLWITLGIVGVLVVVLIASCAIFAQSIGNIMKEASTATATYNSTPTSNDVTPEPTTDGNNTTGGQNVTGGNIGQTLNLQGVDCTLTSVKHIDGDTYNQPKAGTQFVLMHVKINNKSGKSQHYNPLDFKLINSQGQKTTHSYLVPDAYSHQLSFGELAAGGTVEGDLVFEVPVGDHGAKLGWEPVFNEFADVPGTAEWKLGL